MDVLLLPAALLLLGGFITADVLLTKPRRRRNTHPRRAELVKRPAPRGYVTYSLHDPMRTLDPALVAAAGPVLVERPLS